MTDNYEKNWIKFVAVSIFLLGVMNILSAWLSFDSPRLKLIDAVLDYQIISGSRFLVIITGIASLIVAPALFRRKRVAWIASVLILGISGFAHILKGADVEEAGLCLMFLGILLPLYRYCRVKSDPVRIMHGGQILLASILFVASYTILGIHIFSDRLGIDVSAHSIWSIIRDALLFDTSKLTPIGRAAKFYVDSLFIINSFSYLTGLTFALSPVIARNLPEVNYEKYKKFTLKNASQPVQYFTLTKDYQHFYIKDAGVEGIISYKVSDRVALGIGNPCTDGNIEEITDKWINMTREYDWIPAVYQAQDDFVDILKQMGFSAVPIGVEAVVDLKTFTLEGKHMQQLRTGKNKAVKEGWKIKKYEKSDWHKVKELDSKWLSIHGNKENSFAMGKSSPEYLESTRTVLLLDKDDNLMAYLNNIELPRSKTRSVDLMRRNVSMHGSGVMEYLFLNEILAAQEEGLDYYDLGFSPLAKIDEAFSDNKVVTNLFKLIFEKQKRYYDFQGLHLFKSKFGPQWKQSYLVYPKTLELPNVLMSLLNLNKAS